MTPHGADSRNEARCPADIGEAAAFWLARRDRGFSAEDAAAFALWRAADPRHEAEFARLEAAWRRMELAQHSPELVALASRVLADARIRETSPVRVRWRRWGALTLASAAAVMLAWALWWRVPVAPAAGGGYELVPGETRPLTLADGSVVELRGDSAVRAEFTPAERRVRLVRGEAHFTVTKNPARPFLVVAGPVTVRAVGTAFDVRLAPAEIDVLVTEGRVQVDRDEPAETSAASAAPAAGMRAVPVLTAGQRVRISVAPVPGRPSPPVVAALAPMEIDQALAWQKSWLVFTRTPLHEAVEAFNRQASGGAPQLRLDDESLGRRRIGGTFRADNVDGFVRLLEQGFDVRAERRGGSEIVLRPVR